MVEYDFELHLRGRKVFIYFEKTQKVYPTFAGQPICESCADEDSL